MKQWKKSSRWRAAVKRQHDNLRNSWRLSCVRRGSNPFRPIDPDYTFWWQALRMLSFNSFAETKPFPFNAGTTTIRFVTK